MLEFTASTRSTEETQALGQWLGERLQDGDVLLLHGDLGSGKTTFTQGIGRALGTDEVNSPTFILVAEHRARKTLHHVDLYRLGEVADLSDLGIDDSIGQHGITVVEWPDLYRGDWPPERLDVYLSANGGDRIIRFVASGARFEGILNEMAASGETRFATGA